MQHEMQHQTPPSLGYEGEQTQNPSAYHLYGQKLSMPVSGQMVGPGQRLALAIVSLCLLVFLIFGLVIFAAADNAPNWAVIPILFVIALFSAVVAIVNHPGRKTRGLYLSSIATLHTGRGVQL